MSRPKNKDVILNKTKKKTTPKCAPRTEHDFISVKSMTTRWVPKCPINATHKVLVGVEEAVVVLQWLQLQQHLLVQLHLSLIW